MPHQHLRRINASLVVALPDHLPAETLPLLRREVEDAIHAAWLAQVIFDLQEAVFVDSAGIGLMVAVRHWTSALGKDLYLYRPGATVMKALGLVHLADVFSIVDTSQDLDALLARARP
ncbi:MAG: STAS domain-containing protein [Desulfovibrio sp.]|nr:STAS domain-containing protein [Desulfovibrio sp.]MCA1986278.1 STAS domain-containing protein [Desulfovibrio sp.]